MNDLNCRLTLNLPDLAIVDTEAETASLDWFDWLVDLAQEIQSNDSTDSVDLSNDCQTTQTM